MLRSRASFLLVQAVPASAGTPPDEPTELGMQRGVIPRVVGPDRPFVFTRTPELRARVSAWRMWAENVQHS
ncbi:hypothetical protein NLX83_40050 [Allokutzneria sp. A3M-2-11 16]|uniref:hypothetical protein n=1 Tax=Allokutzneria sp. A3M-2-11 16 TaxID=2962043 RepID=UPI0020B77BF3|nr:hypothetical protein [Allokutzneria sp. A3M-2-11 16]MCP3805477.1 hypothetical protein [Allokutzneria sp. A3M-2-11 16]